MANTPNVIIDPVTRIEGHLRIQAYAIPDGKGGGTIKSRPQFKHDGAGR